MEQRLMSQEEFEGLWQEAEAETHARKLVSGYAAWKRRQRWIAVGVMTCLVGAIALFPLQMQQQQKMYDKVYCNRTSIDDSHWVDVASEMLTIEMT